MEDKKYFGRRAWEAYRDAVEAFVKAVEENRNGHRIHCLAQLVRIREKDLDAIEGKES